MGLERGNLWSSEGSDLQSFTDTKIHPWGRGNLWSYKGSDLQSFIDTKIHPWDTLNKWYMSEKGKKYGMSTRSVLWVPYKSAYNYIGRPFITTLDFVVSLVNLNLKYHNLRGESITTNVDLEGTVRISQALQGKPRRSNGWCCKCLEIATTTIKSPQHKRQKESGQTTKTAIKRH